MWTLHGMNPFLLGLRTSVTCAVIAGGLINNTIQLLSATIELKKKKKQATSFVPEISLAQKSVATPKVGSDDEISTALPVNNTMISFLSTSSSRYKPLTTSCSGKKTTKILMTQSLRYTHICSSHIIVRDEFQFIRPLNNY